MSFKLGQAPDAQALYQDLLQRLRADWAQLKQPCFLIGVASGGVALAQRLRRDLGLSQDIGVISSSMHRDDFAQRGLSASALRTDLPFAIDGACVVLVDDVLHTGRTVRAVINELFDYGRPACVRLAVLVDRGQHQLPIAADWAALHCQIDAELSLQLQADSQQRFQFVLERAL